MNTKSIIVAITLVISFIGSNAQNEITNVDFTELKGTYLGQKPPGKIPEIFAPGIISRNGFRDYGITFSECNDLMLYTCDTAGSNKHNIFFCEIENKHWTVPVPIPLSISQSIGEPIFSPSTNKIYFAQLNFNDNNEWEPFIYYAIKTEDEWEVSEVICPGLFASEAYDGTLYFTDISQGEKLMEKANIAKLEVINGEYKGYKLLPKGINTEDQEFHPFISPDESFMIFDSDRPGGFGDYDIYISYKRENDDWEQPINMGNDINTDGYEGVATLSPDGEYLFFNRNEDIYWVSSKVIEELKPRKIK